MRGGFVPAAGTAAGELGATIWVALSEGGLWVAGRVPDDRVRLTRNAAELITADHPEVWLAFEPVGMPPLGYGNQFGLVTPEMDEFCRDPEARARCAAWVDLQRIRRALLERLFVRQYVPTHGGRVRELYAEVAEQDARLALGTVPRCCAAARSAMRAVPGGYAFELHVPPEELPAAAAHPIASARLLVDIVDNDSGARAQEAVWTSAPGRRFGASETFNPLRLAHPLRFDVAPPLLARTFARVDSLRPDSAAADSTGHGVIYFPGRPVHRVFAVANVHQGYQYEPGEPSPGLVPLGLVAERPVGECGPATAVAAVVGVDGLGLTVNELLGVVGGAVLSHVPLVTYDSAGAVRRLARAPCQHLAFVGDRPRSALGTGQGGATPVPTLQVVSLDSAGRMQTLLLEEAETVLARVPPDTSFEQEIVPEHTGHPRGDSVVVDREAPFGFVWRLEGEDKPLRTVLFRWDERARRYVASDSTGRFGGTP